MVNARSQESLNINDFASDVAEGYEGKPQASLVPQLAVTSPYNLPSTPRDVLRFLPPSGEPFSLFGDPYALMHYIKQNFPLVRKGQYWYRGKQEENGYTDQEVALLVFLSKHRCATRSQLTTAIINPKKDDIKAKEKFRDFIRRSVQNGIIVPFTWVTPCPDPNERKQPHIYGLSPGGCRAAADLVGLQYLPKKFSFSPTTYPPGESPSMSDIFTTLIANEFYCKLHELDRVVGWEVNEEIVLNNTQVFRPQYSVKLIKDAQDFKYLWLEVIRPFSNWYERTIARFQKIQSAFISVSSDIKPEIVVLLVDDVSRIPDIAQLAEHFMPDVVIRFTTDNDVIQKEHYSIFYMYDAFNRVLTPASIKFLKPDAPGMRASEFLASYYDEADYLEDVDY